MDVLCVCVTLLFLYFIHLNSHLIHFKGYNCVLHFHLVTDHKYKECECVCAKFVVGKKVRLEKPFKTNKLLTTSKVEGI